MTANLRHAAGNLLVVGLSGTELTPLERAWLKLVRPGGIILFRRNIADAKQTRQLLADATALCSDFSFRCVDVEGGSVDRLRDSLAPLPSAQAVARAMRITIPGADLKSPRSSGREQRGPKTLARTHGELIARAVKAFGFNTTLAPVLDLALPTSARVLGTRAAGATVEDVVEYGRGLLAGVAAHGVVGCGKHFPGLGRGNLDSHLETPAIHNSIRKMRDEDLRPYYELRDELPMVMVNHAAYPDTPSGSRPASASRFWITTVLQKQIGYRGIIFSDDLEMGGILKFLTIEEAAIAAIRAGMDVLEVCHSPELILRAYESLVAEAERSIRFRDLLLERSRRLFLKRRQHFSGRPPAALSLKQFEALRSQVLRFSEVITKAHTTTETEPA